MPDKQNAILVQVAAKVASTLYSGTGDLQGYETALNAILPDLQERVADADAMATVTPITPVTQEQLAPAVDAVASIKQSFPNATEAQSASHTPAPPKPINGYSKDIDKWEDAVFHNPQDWKVWRSEKSSHNGGRSPDVTHENALKDDGNKVGFWLISNYGPEKSAPRWVWEGLGLQAEFAQNLAQGKVLG
tara:strand:- start:2227 stop:2796 length:570 start_codon:yes stop_codon:yes gene_type:complete